MPRTRSPIPRWHSALFALGLIGIAAPDRGVRAQAMVTRGPALNWVRLSGAESCIAPVELARRVEERLGRAVFVRASDAIVVVEGRVGPSAAGGFSVVLQVSDPDGTMYGAREVDSPGADCRELDDAVALIIAITLRRERASAGWLELPESVAAELDRLFASDSAELDPASLQPSAARATEEPSVMVPPPAVHSALLRPTSALSFSFDVGIAVTTGLQLSATLGPHVRAHAAIRDLGRIGAEAALAVARDDEVEGTEQGSLNTRLWYTGLSLCGPSWGGERFELSLCATGRLGSLRVRASEFVASNTSETELWFELGAEADARLLFDPLYVQLTLGVPVRVVAPEFRYTNRAGIEVSALSVARVGLHAGVGAGLRF